MSFHFWFILEIGKINSHKSPKLLYTDDVKHFFSLLFLPQEKNNHRALFLQPGFLGILIALYLLNQSFIRSFTIIKPGVLGYSSEITSKQIFDLTNEERQKNGLSPLYYNSILSESAAKKAQDMFANNYWAHNSPSGKTPWDFFKEAGYTYITAGENLAKDFYDNNSVIKAWMNSPTHKANILNEKYQEIGIGVVNGVLDGVKTTLVVQHFGNPKNQIVSASAPAKVLSETSVKAISPLTISKIIGALMFLTIISVLIVDSVITLRSGIQRMTGSTTGHICFLLIVLLLMLFSHQGAIF